MTVLIIFNNLDKNVCLCSQFLACLLCPNFLDDPSYPQDVKEKARRILKTTPGFAISAHNSFFALVWYIKTIIIIIKVN